MLPIMAYHLPLATPFGYVCTSGMTYVLERDSEGNILKLSTADISFIRRGRLPKEFDLSLPFPGAPDLAIEVTAPDDGAAAILAKVRDYQNAGTEQVWVLYSRQEEVFQYVHDEISIHIYKGTDTIQAESLSPGLTIAVQDVFVMPAIE